MRTALCGVLYSTHDHSGSKDWKMVDFVALILPR